MLVVMQDYSEAFNEVNRANVAILVFLHLSAATILIVTILITRYMIKLIRKRDTQADRLNRQLMQAGKLAAVGELSAGVAHEINNPLAIVLTERQILLDSAEQTPDLDDRFRRQLIKSLHQMDLQVHRCKRITQNLLRFSRRTKPSIETVDLNAFITEVIELVEREAKTSGIRFLADLEENLPSLLSDPSQLQQVFLNMITNAIDAHDGKPYGIIHISTQSDDQNRGVRILIADTGSGISPECISKVFDPFFTTKPVGKGTGLGLSICYSSIKQLGGDITVKSDQGEGTEFTIFLPYRPPMNPNESMPEGHEIDDMTRLLTTRGYLVTAVDNGEAALQILGEKDFDVIVLDLKMPGMDGITTLKEIGKLGLFAQTLILTGHGSIDTALEAIKLGAYDYLTKPCEIDDLVNKIEGAWEKKNEKENKDTQEKIQKVVESPSSVFDLFPKRKD
jgi:signal transduction histidine kinase/CheY-like chemotaxis protein